MSAADMSQIAHKLTENVKLLQKVAVVAPDGKVLLLQRSAGEFSRPGCWDLPGGNSEWPTDGRAGFGLHQGDIARELEEETGIVCAPAAFTHEALTYFQTFFDAEKQVYSIICGWRTLLLAGTTTDITLSHEHSAFAWVQISQLDEYDFGGEKGAFVKEIARKGAG